MGIQQLATFKDHIFISMCCFLYGFMIFLYLGTKHSKISPKYLKIYYDYFNLYIDVDLSENETSQLVQT